MSPPLVRALKADLPQSRTNGKSLWGTLLAGFLPTFLTNNPLPNGFPWSTLDWNTNFYQTTPNTGIIRKYDFTISRGVIAPDGYQRDVLLVNGAFPGPLIEANWGDTIQVKMTNNITGPEEGTALHWHGILQKGHPWQDGVPAVTQCPVAPGKSFTYSFTADLYGSSWYHSHYSAQYAGGLFGPMVIHGPSKQKYDIDVGPIMLSDWYHKEYFDLVEETMDPAAAGPVFSDNNLINGKNNYDCSQLPSDDKTPCNSNAGISKFKFKKNKVHRLRLINPGAEALQRFSIDGHKMTVIANDFVPVEPYETDVVTIGIGQRTDVLVKADQTPGAYYMRSNISTICSLGRNPNAVAAIYYDGTDETKTPDSKAWDRPDPGTCANDDLTKTKPTFKLKPPTPDTVYDIEVSLGRNATGHLLWSMDDVSFRGNFNSPTFLLAKLGNLTFDPIWNVKNTKKAKSVRVHVINNTPVAHPMHLHGFNMYILNEGTGTWDGTTVNPSNPQRRDVQQLRGGGYMVMQFDAADNPGVWPFHCHIAWHVSAGLFTQFLTQPDKVKNYNLPLSVAQTCRDWGKWTNTNIPEQIDSGL